MASIVLRPRKATEIVDAAIEVYRRNPVHFMLLTAIVQVPWLLLAIVLLGSAPPTAQLMTSLLINLGTAVSYYMMAPVVVQMASDLYLGRDTDAFESMRRVGWRFPAAFAAAFIQGFLLILGLTLLLFPAAYWSAIYFAVVPVIVLERKGLFGSFSRSSHLSNGLKLHILLALGVVFIIRIAITLGASVLVVVFTKDPQTQRIIAALVAIVVNPLSGIADTLIYYDARIRREGFDIEMMAGSADPGAPEVVVA